ncbi:MAG: type II toxin-antitoxin system VapC family toxin, partial [Ignavibacteria bacterium]|nr:type II toxin-antitoxin system VapC family toxin [Ignavibacteria bacterium]
MNLVDSSGWLEYFAGGKNAKFFANAIQDTKNLLVSTINIYEIYKKILTERDESSALQALGLMQQGKVVDISLSI